MSDSYYREVNNDSSTYAGLNVKIKSKKEIIQSKKMHFWRGNTFVFLTSKKTAIFYFYFESICDRNFEETTYF